MATKPTKDKQTNNRPIFFDQINYHLKKTGPGQIQIQDFCRPKRNRYHQAKCARKTPKFEFIMKQGTSGIQ